MIIYQKIEALEKEINLTEYYLDIQQCFCNIKIRNKQSDSTKYLIGKINTGKQLTNKQKEYLSKIMSKENNPMYNKHRSKETKKLISLANTSNTYCLNRKLSLDTKKKK